MSLKNVFCNLISLLLISTPSAGAPPPRIGRIAFDQSKVMLVEVYPGKSLIMKLPCNIKTFSSGPTKDIMAEVNARDSQIIEVWLSKNAAQPSELKIFCPNAILTFDIVPSRDTHQSVIEISKIFGKPNLFSRNEKEQAQGTVIMSSSGLQQSKMKPKVIRVISSSKSGASSE